MKLTIPSSGNYQVRIRVRSGDRNNNSSYFSNGYQIKVNNQVTSFNGDENSISEKDTEFGIAYWGDLVSNTTVSLIAGIIYIEIESLKNWCLVDSIEIIATTTTTTTTTTNNNNGSRTDEASFSFRVFPNPSKGLINILDKKGKSDKVKKMLIYNMLGELVYYKKAGTGSLKTLNINHLKKGIYILKIKTDNSMYAEQFILE